MWYTNRFYGVICVKDTIMGFTEQALRDQGFQGFLTFRELREGRMKEIPEEAGAYVILYTAGTKPRFLERNPGYHFKKKDPTKDVYELDDRWVDGAHVVYIGKADSKSGKLRERINRFSKFGEGKAAAHKGGYPIWQIENSAQLVVAWKTRSDEETAGNLEARLQIKFCNIYGRLPFGNGKKEKQK